MQHATTPHIFVLNESNIILRHSSIPIDLLLSRSVHIHWAGECDIDQQLTLRMSSMLTVSVLVDTDEN